MDETKKERAERHIQRLLFENEKVTSATLAAVLNISRQSAQAWIRKSVQNGQLVKVGKGRATAYVSPDQTQNDTTSPNTQQWQFNTSNLLEDEVWEQIEQESSIVASLDDDSKDCFQYALTELVNNVIDHSESTEVEVAFSTKGTEIEMQISDSGIGIFENLKTKLNLSSHKEAIQELSKGKSTTMPDAHTGEGIFFSSKSADYFEIESDRLCWTVDNDRNDMAIGNVDPPRQGTLVRYRINPRKARNLEDIFARYTENHQFTRSETHIRLFEFGTKFVSRSEAKRLVNNLTKFSEVVLDFSNVTKVGQGFADQVFRVWARAHPEVRLIPINMVDPVRFMVERARRHKG